MNGWEDFAQWAAARGLTISAEQRRQFELFMENLLCWNERINLTAITDENEILTKHFADSLTLLPWLTQTGARLLDVGAGAGFPGIPIKIIRPDIRMTLLDATNKRVNFLNDTVSLLGLDGVECLHARAEELSRDKTYRASYDVCAARAVARLDKLAKYCLPFVKPSGLFLAMKGPDVSAELNDALPALRKYRGEHIETRLIEIVPGLSHSVVAVRKTG
jgi:16S rRNA (guanine527-N7)-methyltransferase